jgi:soluble lytic murein transglycosylase
MLKKRIYFIVIFFVFFVGIFVYFFLPLVLAKYVYLLKYSDLIKKYSLESGVDPNLVAAMIWNESHFNEKAVSSAGALGLMQIMPQTAKGIAKEFNEDSQFFAEKLFEPETNIRYGTWYLAHYINKYQDVTLALIAYNSGYTLADKYAKSRNRTDINKETLSYLENVWRVKEIYESMYGNWWEKEEIKPRFPFVLIKNFLNFKLKKSYF